MKTTLQKATPTTVELSTPSISNTFSLESMYDVKISNLDLLLDIAQNRIYTRKVGAFVREVLCNAVDSQTISKSSTPIELDFPTMFDSFFRVRDFGKGMSPEEISNVYFSYGGTTKNTNNKSIGGFGIGCLSPLAYTDHFFIESYYKGKKYSYTIFKSGSPKASVVPTLIENTTEPSGFRVSIPVNSTDFKELEKELILYLFFCTQSVNVNNNDNIRTKILEEMSLFSKEFSSPNNFLLGLSSSYKLNFGTDSKHFIVVGGVPYTFNISSLKDTSFDNLKKFALFIYLPIGSIDIPPARESVEYTEKTIKVIKNKLQDLTEEIRSRFSESQKHHLSLIKCRESCQGYTTKQLLSVIKDKFYFKGQLVFSTVDVYKDNQVYYNSYTLKSGTIVSGKAPSYRSKKPFAGFLNSEIVILYPDVPLNKSETWAGKSRQIIYLYSNCPAIVILKEKMYPSFQDVLNDVNYDGYTILKSSDIQINKKSSVVNKQKSNNIKFTFRKLNKSHYSYLDKWTTNTTVVETSEVITESTKLYLGITLFDRQETEKYLPDSAHIDTYLKIMGVQNKFIDVVGVMSDSPKVKNIIHYDAVVEEYIKSLTSVQKDTIAKLSCFNSFSEVWALYTSIFSLNIKYPDKNFKEFIEKVGFVLKDTSTTSKYFVDKIATHPEINKLKVSMNTSLYNRYIYTYFYYFRPYTCNGYSYPETTLVDRKEFIQNLVDLTKIPKF